jgi:hypothetical protein
MSGFDGVGEIDHEFTDAFDRQPTEWELTERGDEALAAIDLIPGPGTGFELRSSLGEPALPVSPEGLLGVAHLSSFDLLDGAPAGIARAALPREARFEVWVASLRR